MERLLSWHCLDCGDWDGFEAEPTKYTEEVAGGDMQGDLAFRRQREIFQMLPRIPDRVPKRHLSESHLGLRLQCHCWFRQCSERRGEKCLLCLEATSDLSLKLTSNVYF